MGVVQAVNELTAAGIHVVLTAQDMVNTGKTHAVGSPNWESLVAWWGLVIDHIGNNPLVAINWANETHPTRDGWVAYNTAVRDLLRGMGWTGEIIVDCTDWGQDLQWCLTQPIIDDVTYGWHAYGAMRRVAGDPWAALDLTAAEVRALMDNTLQIASILGVPVFIGEFGVTQDSSGGWNARLEEAAAEAVMDLAPAYGVRACWWHGGHWDAFSLRTDNTAAFYDETTVRSAWGNIIWDATP